MELPKIARRVVTACTSFFTSGSRYLQPERRSGMRIITLKNAGWLALSVTVVFVIFSAYMERRSRGTSDYGRLYDRRIEETRPASTAAQPEVVLEAPERPAGTSVLQRGRGDVLLEVTDTEAATTDSAAGAAPVVKRPVRLRRDGNRVVISGGTEGVRTGVQPAAPQPELGRVPPATTTEPPSQR
jgi:hypothetical protein